MTLFDPDLLLPPAINKRKLALLKSERRKKIILITILFVLAVGLCYIYRTEIYTILTTEHPFG